jgi:hypothetical protein
MLPLPFLLQALLPIPTMALRKVSSLSPEEHPFCYSCYILPISTSSFEPIPIYSSLGAGWVEMRRKRRNTMIKK